MDKDQERKAFFDERAEGWEARNYAPDKRERLIQMVKAFALAKNARVLDAGCGEGVLFPYFREAIGPAGQIIALDASEAMLHGAAKKEDNKALTLLAPAENIPLIQEYVDTVVCFAAFPHFSDKAQAAREFFRILRPQGKAYIAHLMSREELSQHHGKHHAVCGDLLPCPYTMRKMFQEAGFEKTDLEERSGWYLFTAEKE